VFLPLRTLAASPLPEDLVLRTEPAGEALCATRDYAPGEVVFGFDGGELRARRDPSTVELPDGRHLFHPVLTLATHACEPNCRLDLEGRLTVAVRAIAAGEAITCDYETTERWFSHPFWCRCGARRCRGRIG
jgi:uncharacterized protein